MDDEDLMERLHSFIRCGNSISKRSTTLLSSTIRSFAYSTPDVLIRTIKTLTCEFDSAPISIRVLSLISNDLQELPAENFIPITATILGMLGLEHRKSILSPIHNASFILPTHALSSEEANEIAMKIVDLLSNFNDCSSLQMAATTLSQFLKKWASIIPHPEIPAMRLFTIISNEGLSYTVLSLLCQSAVYLILALIGDSPLKDIVNGMFERRGTILDRCTSVSQIVFLEYILQSIPRAAQFQLIGSFLFSLNEDQLTQVADRFPLLQNCIRHAPRDELGLTCYYTMLSAVLKATAKQMTPKALNMCTRALLSCPHPRDVASRKATRLCLATILQCSSHISDQKKFNEMMFYKIMKLPTKSVFRQDSLPLIIPTVGFNCITLEFFEYLVSLFDSHQGLAVRCMHEVYRTFNVPLEYSTLLIKKLDQMTPTVRLAMWSNILKPVPRAMATIQRHIRECHGIDENRRLDLRLSLASIEAQMTRNAKVDNSLLRDAIHSWNFEVRLAALKLLSVRQRFDEESLEILFESIPRVFVYSDIADHPKSLEIALESIITKCSDDKLNRFIKTLFAHMIPLLKPHQSGTRKSYIIDCLRIVWRHKPLHLLTVALLEQLILGLFESSYALRDSMFRTVLLVLKCQRTQEQDEIIDQMLNERNHFVKKLIQKYRESERFREADGAARLMALLNIRKQTTSGDDMVHQMGSDFIKERKEKKDTIPSHFPLSVILHYLQSSQDGLVNSRFLIRELLPSLCSLIRDSLDVIGVESNVETIPIQSIMSETPESQLQISATKSWLAVRQALSIISWIVNKYFDTIPSELLQQIGKTLFNFMVDSRHYSAVYYAHLTFQVVCTRCFMREDVCAEYPIEWCDSIIDAAGTFTFSDHNCSSGFVQTAMALIHSESSHLFGSQRSIYHKLLKMCIVILENPGSKNELMSALLLTEAIVLDNQSQANFEPYAPRVLMAVLTVHCNRMERELWRVANRCLGNLLLKHWQRKDESKEPQLLLSGDFFETVKGSFDFFHEHLVIEQPNIAYVILQIIQMMAPFSDLGLAIKISQMRKSPHSRVRKAAARALLVVIGSDQAIHFVRKSIRDLHMFPEDRQTRKEEKPSEIVDSETNEIQADGNLDEIEVDDDEVVEEINSSSESESEEEVDANMYDGVLMQIQLMVRKFPSIKEPLTTDIEQLCHRLIEYKVQSFMKIYFVIQLAKEFGCLSIVKPILVHLCRIRKQLMVTPMGHQMLRTALQVLDDTQLMEILKSKDEETIVHLLLQLKGFSPEVASVCIDVFLRDTSQSVLDVLGEMFLRYGVTPNEGQREKFMKILLEITDDQMLETMLHLAPMFITNAKLLFKRFEKFGEFVDRSDSNVMECLSNLALQFESDLFSEFDECDYSHWKIALRIISDENPNVRAGCSKALSHQLMLNERRVDLCEFDLIQSIYTVIGAKSRNVLKQILEEFREIKELDDDTPFKIEPAPFLHPPSFHIRCIKSVLKVKR